MTEDPLLDLALRIADGHPLSSDAFNAAMGHDQGTVSRLRQIHKVAQLALDDDINVSSVHDSIRTGTTATPDGPLRWGQLEILEKIGRGAYGDIYRARDPRLGREVALKLLRERAAGRSCALVEEGHLLSRVRHPNVVTVYGADFIDGRAGLWMELISGDTLEDELQRTGPLAPGEVVRIGTTLCSALAAVHAAGLLHRDIKAQNIMRDVSGRLVLMDFGSGRTQSEVDVADLAGTPLYLAPEVFEGAEASSRTEVYSLGVLLWHLATGGFPVAAKTMGELRSLHASRSKTELPPDLAQRALGQVIARCLVRDPSVRYATATDVSAALSESAAAGAAVRRKIVLGTVVLAWALAMPHSSLSLGYGHQTALPWPHQGFLFNGAPTNDGRLFGCGFFPSAPVAVCDLSAGSVTAVKIQEDVGRQPFWTTAMISPEGTRVAYGSRAHEEIKIIDLLSSETTAIRVDPEMSVSLVGWRPDGSRLLVLLSNTKTNRAALVDPVTSLETPLYTFDSRPDSLSLSPDGGSLAFTARGDLFMVDIQASQLLRLPVGGRTQAVTWAPDNQQLITSTLVLGKWEIHALRIDKGRWTGRHVRLEQFEDRHVMLLGTSAHDIFFMRSGKPPSLYVTTFKPETLEAGAVQWSTNGTSDNAFDWSPDGSVLAFARSEPEPLSTGRGVIVLRNIMTGTERTISLPGGSGDPSVVRWSPNGRSLLVSQAGMHYLFDPHTGDSRVTASLAGASLMTEWAEDGKTVFHSSNQAVESYATDTGEHGPRRLLPAMPRSMHLDRGGSTLAWSDGTLDRTRIWVEPYFGGAAKVILLSDSRCFTVGWLNDQVFVTCTNDGSEKASLRLIDPRSGHQRYVRLPISEVSNIRLALGTSRLAVLSTRTPGGLFVRALPSPDQY